MDNELLGCKPHHYCLLVVFRKYAPLCFLWPGNTPSCHSKSHPAKQTSQASFLWSSDSNPRPWFRGPPQPPARHHDPTTCGCLTLLPTPISRLMAVPVLFCKRVKTEQEFHAQPPLVYISQLSSSFFIGVMSSMIWTKQPGCCSHRRPLSPGPMDVKGAQPIKLSNSYNGTTKKIALNKYTHK